MSEMEMEIDDPSKLEFTNLNGVEYAPNLWYNYRIGMKKTKNNDYVNDYIPIVSLVKYDEMKSKTKDIMDFFKSQNPPMNEDPNSYDRRFGQLVFEKDPITNQIMIRTMDVESKYSYLKVDIKLSDVQKMNPGSIITLQDFAIEIIKESNLLGTILQTVMSGKKIVILFDFYYNRSGRVQFHKDRYDYDTKYVSLTYDNDTIMFGPDVIAYPTNMNYRASKNEELEVFRPLLPSYSRIGFNDELLSHSSPYSKLPEKVDVCKDTAGSNVDLCQQVVLKPSPYRVGNMEDLTKRTFIRCWFQEAPYTPMDDEYKSLIIQETKMSIEEFKNLLSPLENIAQIDIYYYDDANVTKDLFKNIVINMNKNLVNHGGSKKKRKQTRKLKQKRKKHTTTKHKKKH